MVRVATLLECPEVVGSLDSMAFTLAFMNPSKRIWIESKSSAFSSATAACDATDSITFATASSKGLTFFIAKTLLDAKNIEGVTGLGSEPVITRLIRAGLLTYQGSNESQIGNSNIGLLLVSDVANKALNQNLFLPLLKKIVDEGLAGSTVAIEMATAVSLTDEFVKEVRSAPQLASSVSTVNDVNSFMGQIVFLSSLENLPLVTHYDEKLFIDTVKSK